MSVPMRRQDTVGPQESYQPFPKTGSRRALRRKRKFWSFVLRVAALAAICLGVGWGTKAAVRTDPSELRLARHAPMIGQVELVTAKAERRLGFVTITGDILSRTSHKLAHVEAVVELLDGHNKTVGLESGLVAFDPLPAKEAVPFQVVMQDQPNAVAYRVHIRELLGRILD